MFFIYVQPNDFEAELIGPFSRAEKAVRWASDRLPPGTWHDVKLTSTEKWDTLNNHRDDAD